MEEMTTAASDDQGRMQNYLTVVAGLFLPPTLIVGVLALSNMSGYPHFLQQGEAFWFVVGLLVVLFIAELLFFWKLGWIKDPWWVTYFFLKRENDRNRIIVEGKRNMLVQRLGTSGQNSINSQLRRPEAVLEVEELLRKRV